MNRINDGNRYLFEELVNQIRLRSGAAGIAVAIVDEDGNTAYENFWGYRDVERKSPIDQDTIFGMASVTKSFVALSVMQLCEKGLLDLDDPVSRYIPEFTNKNQKTVRIRHFLNHSAGFYPMKRIQIKNVAEEYGYKEDELGDLAFVTELADLGVKLVAEQLDEQTVEHGLIGVPGQYLSYCNDGFGLLAEIVRRVSGEKSFSDYVRKHVLDPLGMDRSGCEYLRPKLDVNSSILYKRVNGELVGTTDFYNMGFVLSGAGAMRSTLADMKKVVTMYLNGGRILKGKDGSESEKTCESDTYAERVLSLEGIRTMCRPSIEYRPESWYCMGLSTKKLDDLTIVEHGGSQTGVSSNMSWSFEAGAGVIVLCNTSDVPVSVIADAAMRMFHGRNPIDNRGNYQENSWSEKTRNAALGRYSSGEDADADVEIFMDGETVCVRADGKIQPFVMVNETTGLIRGYVKDAYVKLFKDGDGAVFSIGYGGRMLPKRRDT